MVYAPHGRTTHVKIGLSSFAVDSAQTLKYGRNRMIDRGHSPATVRAYCALYMAHCASSLDPVEPTGSLSRWSYLGRVQAA